MVFRVGSEGTNRYCQNYRINCQEKKECCFCFLVFINNCHGKKLPIPFFFLLLVSLISSNPYLVSLSNWMSEKDNDDKGIQIICVEIISYLSRYASTRVRERKFKERKGRAEGKSREEVEGGWECFCNAVMHDFKRHVNWRGLYRL